MYRSDLIYVSLKKKFKKKNFYGKLQSKNENKFLITFFLFCYQEKIERDYSKLVVGIETLCITTNHFPSKSLSKLFTRHKMQGKKKVCRYSCQPNIHEEKEINFHSPSHTFSRARLHYYY